MRAISPRGPRNTKSWQAEQLFGDGSLHETTLSSAQSGEGCASTPIWRSGNGWWPTGALSLCAYQYWPEQIGATATARSIRGDRRHVSPLVEDVVLGCVDPVGEGGGRHRPRQVDPVGEAGSVTSPRSAALKAGYGWQVPGVQINRFCASGLDSVNLAAAQVMSGMKDMAIGGGVESMSRIGMGASGGAWPVDPKLAIDTISCRRASRPI
jgi:hypothetical protein